MRVSFAMGAIANSNSRLLVDHRGEKSLPRGEHLTRKYCSKLRGVVMVLADDSEGEGDFHLFTTCW